MDVNFPGDGIFPNPCNPSIPSFDFGLATGSFPCVSSSLGDETLALLVNHYMFNPSVDGVFSTCPKGILTATTKTQALCDVSNVLHATESTGATRKWKKLERDEGKINKCNLGVDLESR